MKTSTALLTHLWLSASLTEVGTVITHEVQGGIDAAIQFVCDLSHRLANRVQVTTDGHRAYLEAVEAGFGADVDYAQLIKLYGEALEGQRR